MLATDPEARVYGWAKCLYDAGRDPNIDLPALSQITQRGEDGYGELWVGGAGVWPQVPFQLPDDFDYVLQLTKREHFDIDPITMRDVVIMADTAEQGFSDVDLLADNLVSHLSVGHTVLVHCQVGMNRSGLIAAATLVKLGYAPDLAIQLLRDLRDPVVLCNPSFEAYIRGLA